MKKNAEKKFSCKQDALQNLSAFKEKLKFHKLSSIEVKEVKKHKARGRPKKGSNPQVLFHVQAQLTLDEKKVECHLNRKGKFIVASNELDKDKLSAEELLDYYKEQQCVERGFRFLKDPLFFTSSTFLKKETRIVALSMIMCLCLLVYTLAQRLLRMKMELSNQSLPNQAGKNTKNPTMRWIFQIFEGVHILSVTNKEGEKEEHVLNLNPLRKKILGLLGPEFEKIYESSS